jgi:hypothetical protein
MKARQSGMPDEPMWDQFFDPHFILRGLGIQNLLARSLIWVVGMEPLLFRRRSSIKV